nr:TAXI family TRAP transporter solute-binding subunit [Halomonas socia]
MIKHTLYTVVAFATLAFAVTSHAKDYSTDYEPITVAAGSVGGSWFVGATALLDLFDDNIDGLSYSVSPGGGVGNPHAVQQGEAQMAIAYTTNLHAAAEGHEPYGEPLEDLRAVMNMNITSVMHTFALQQTGLEELSDIADQEYGISIDTGTRGTGGEQAASRVLEAHGASYDNLRSWGGQITHSEYREALDRLRDGHIEAFMNDDVVGHPLFVDVTVSRDLNLLGFTPEVVDELQSSFGYTPSIIPENTYEGQDSEVLTVGQQQALFVHKDMPDDLVMAMLELVFENKERLETVHSSFENLDLESAANDLSVPLHPGAELYYKEAGVL